MNAEDLIIDNSCKWEEVKYFSTILPHIEAAVLTETFIVESVNLCYLAGLMISTQKCDSSLIADFQSEKENEGLHRVESTIYVVSQEEVGDEGCLSPDAKQF